MSHWISSTQGRAQFQILIASAIIPIYAYVSKGATTRGTYYFDKTSPGKEEAGKYVTTAAINRTKRRKKATTIIPPTVKDRYKTHNRKKENIKLTRNWVRESLSLQSSVTVIRPVCKLTASTWYFSFQSACLTTNSKYKLSCMELGHHNVSCSTGYETGAFNGGRFKWTFKG